MRLTALTTMKIEGDVLEEFVRHTLQLVDRLIVVDNGSLDMAAEILGELQAEGLPVTVWEGEAVPSTLPSGTALARRAFATFKTDYLLMLDVDEFVTAVSRPVLEAALASLGDVHALVPMVTYVPTSDDDPNEPRVLARIRHRLHHEARSFSKVFVHRSFMEHPGASIMAGNHGVFDPDGSAISSVLPGVELAHFPVRSLRQIQSKALLGWPWFLAMGFTEEQNIAYQWRQLNDRLQHDPHWDASEFYNAAWHYLDEGDQQPEFVLDPLPTVELRYRRQSPELLPLAVAFTRQLARAYGSRPRQQSPSPVLADVLGGGDHARSLTRARSSAPAQYGEYERNEHWLSYFADVADAIVRTFRPDTVLDAGCRLGLLVEALWDRDVRAEGIDQSRAVIDGVRPDVRGHCRVASLTETIDGSFDLVTCIEVLDRLDSADAEVAIANLCSVTSTVVFSSNPSPSSEPTRVNICSPIVWIELFAAHGFGPDLLADATFVTPHTMVFRRGYPCDATTLKAYAALNRLRTISSERLTLIGAERANAQLARDAQTLAEAQIAREAQLRCEALAAAETARSETQAALEYGRAQAQAVVDAARAETVAALEKVQHVEARAAAEANRYAETLATAQAQSLADAQAILELRQRADDEMRLRAEAVATFAAEKLRYQKQVHELHILLRDMQGSNSWRLTLPIRVGANFVREALERLGLRRAHREGQLEARKKH